MSVHGSSPQQTPSFKRLLGLVVPGRFLNSHVSQTLVDHTLFIPPSPKKSVGLKHIHRCSFMQGLPRLLDPQTLPVFQSHIAKDFTLPQHHRHIENRPGASIYPHHNTIVLAVNQNKDQSFPIPLETSDAARMPAVAIDRIVRTWISNNSD